MNQGRTTISQAREGVLQEPSAPDQAGAVSGQFGQKGEAALEETHTPPEKPDHQAVATRLSIMLLQG